MGASRIHSVIPASPADGGHRAWVTERRGVLSLAQQGGTNVPRYFFHFRDDQDFLDKNGTVLPGPAAARAKAIEALCRRPVADYSSAAYSDSCMPLFETGSGQL